MTAIRNQQPEMDELARLKIANRRRRIAWDVRDSVRMGFRTHHDLTTKPGHSAADIQIAVELGEIYQADDGIYEVMPRWAIPDPSAPSAVDFTSPGDKAQNRAEDFNNPLALIFDGLKLKNGSRAEKDGYWFYVGTLEDCDKASLECFDSYGVESTVKRNGKTQCWKFIIPFWLNFGTIGNPLEKLTKNDSDSQTTYNGSLRDCLFAGQILSGLGFETRVTAANGNNALIIEN